MPFKFWKKEKPEKVEEEKGKEEKAAGKPTPPPEERKPEPVVAKRPAPEPPGKAVAKALAPADELLGQVHASLVDLGLTVAATKDIFLKRVAALPGGTAGFQKDYETEAYRAVTRVLASWLGVHAAPDFDPGKLLAEVNPRLSSFGLNVEVHDLSWLDQELGLRKARLRLGEQEKVVRFKDARDFLKGVNDLIAPKRIRFIELETWSDDFAFLMVRDPKWEQLAATELVVVKEPETASGGECGECGAKVGRYWNDCLSCGAVFG